MDILFNVIAIILLTVIQQSQGQQQKFRIKPQDLQVLEGAEALLRCEVQNLGGQVQWTKDGFALGFSAVIPGFPRYSVLGDRNQGVYNLRINNASIEDDAEYQCQVGPAKGHHTAIRANAKLTVISPPASVEIQGYSQNSKVEVRQNQDLTLTCVASDAKPAAQIQWFRGNVEFKPENRDDKVIQTHGKRFTTMSVLRLRPTADDDYTEYTCQAKHKALQANMPMRATVQLSVLYPPGTPYIEGYQPSETLRRGQNVELICRSRGGNPPAQLIWYKNGVQVRMAYRTAGRLSENIYTFTAEASDNKARFRCEASNIMSQTPLKTEVDLTVLFAPSHVTVSGPSEARVGDPVPLTCTTAPSNPRAEIRWMVGGQMLKNTTARTMVSPEGGWITTSNITAVVEPNKGSLVVICHGINMQLSENIVSTHTVNVLHPPSPPIISGYVEGSIIPAGSVQKLLCVSSGGNPLAILTWFKNDKKINTVTKSTDKTVTSELTILANVTDNQARYRCEAHNAATEIPLFETKTLSVHFAPETVKIRVEPEELKPNMETVLFCDSSSSNPPAQLTWWRDGIPVDTITNSSKPGLWGGTISSAELKVNITEDMNGIVYTCQSTNSALERSVHEVTTLHVLYPPVFSPPPSNTVVGIENESLKVPLVARANPDSIAYTWTKDGTPITNTGNGRIASEGPLLNITKLTRNDAGVYTCEAVNSQGSATINITVIVEYGTSITKVSENIVTDHGKNATLSCTVEGKPLSEEHVRWERQNYDMSLKTKTIFQNNTSYLFITNVQREDVGNFRCIADNRVANPTSRDVLLIVKFVPEIDKSPTKLRSATGAGERGRLPCRVQAAPKPQIFWARNGQNLNANQTAKYFVEFRQIDALTFESVLLIEKVAPADYGEYECMARNDEGVAKEFIKLEITAPPDSPTNLTVLNVTHDTVTLSWTPGFDGGMKASYRLRYREANSEHYRYEDGMPNAQKLTVTGLRTNAVYLFSIMAINSLGNSSYLPDLVKAQTKEAPPPSQPASPYGGPHTTTSTPVGTTSGLLLLVGVVSGTSLVLLNVLLIGCCLHRRTQKKINRELLPAEKEKAQLPKLVIIGIALAGLGLLLINATLVTWFIIRKRSKAAEANQQNSKSATIEMYAPSSYNDTVTGETLSSVSEKSETYSNEGSQTDYLDEPSKKAASTYLVENLDMPPPRYQKDGTLSSHYPNTNSINPAHHTRTLPHPRHNNSLAGGGINQQRLPRDDNMIGKTSYIPAPSPAPPLDGSYYNMNSDRYLSYPPMDYSVEFPASVMPPGLGGGGGTLGRGSTTVGLVPPDVTHHTTHAPKSTDISLPPLSTIKPQGILKDPSRHLNNNISSGTSNGMQILNVKNAGSGIGMGINKNLLASAYDQHNLSSFNAQMGYTDADGHLV